MALFKILLVEKEKDIRSNWTELLKICKYDVTSSSDLKVFGSIEKYDVIIADTDIVGVDGLQLKALLNNDSSRIPIIFTSADKVPEILLDRDEIAGIAFLRKPFDNHILLEHVEKSRQYKELIKTTIDASRAIARLIIRQPGAMPVELILIRSYTFGRFRDSDDIRADVRLCSAIASRKHAFLVRVWRGADSYYKLIDFSSNGIQVNGRRIQGVQVLRNGDRIEFYPGSEAVYEAIDRNALDLDQTLSSEEG